jgi:hypothetical protein
MPKISPSHARAAAVIRARCMDPITSWRAFEARLTNADARALRHIARRSFGRGELSLASSSPEWSVGIAGALGPDAGDPATAVKLDRLERMIVETGQLEEEMAWLAGIGYGMITQEARFSLLRLALSAIVPKSDAPAAPPQRPR